MKPTRFPQQTVELQPPAGMTEAECGILAVHRTGVHCISRWKPSLGERLRVAFGGPIWLWVWSGNTQPPVALTTESPFSIMERGEEPATGEHYRKAGAMLLLAMPLLLGAALVSCTPKPPPQPPQPPEPKPCVPACPASWNCVDGTCVDSCAGVSCPSGVPCRDGICHVPVPVPVHLELLLRQEGGKLSRGGKPFDMFGAIPCWDPLEKDHGGWAGFSKEWVDYASAKGANAYHMRLGPAPTDPPDATWHGTNGLNEGMSPYVDDDVSKGFKEEWWLRALGQVRYAEAKGGSVEIDLLDGWNCKHAQWGEDTSVWKGADLAQCGNTLTANHKAFLKKAVQTFGCEGGVIWMDGNELGQLPNYDPQWSLSMRDLVRQYEQEVGCGIVHMFGTNSEREAVETAVDYIAIHKPETLTGPRFNRFIEVNEHNPPFDPVTERAKFCAARQAGQAWWYWRGAQSKADMDTTMDLFGAGCDVPAPNLCPDPQPDPTKLAWTVKCDARGVCDPTPTQAKDCDYCASIGMGEIGGVIRCTCPARNECPGFQCESRVACERVLMQADFPVWRGDGQIDFVDENHFRVRCESCTWLEVCNGPQTICARAY